jgi:hypothetical protein
MNCQLCTAAGHSRPAVGLCPACSSALCLDHALEHERRVGPGGTSYGCGHRVWIAPGTRRAAA